MKNKEENLGEEEILSPAVGKSVNCLQESISKGCYKFPYRRVPKMIRLSILARYFRQSQKKEMSYKVKAPIEEEINLDEILERM